MKYKIFDTEKIKLRSYIFLGIFIIAISASIIGVVFDILFLPVIKKHDTEMK